MLISNCQNSPLGKQQTCLMLFLMKTFMLFPKLCSFHSHKFWCSFPLGRKCLVVSLRESTIVTFILFGKSRVTGKQNIFLLKTQILLDKFEYFICYYYYSAFYFPPQMFSLFMQPSHSQTLEDKQMNHHLSKIIVARV